MSSCAERKPLARGDANLQLHQVQSGHQFGHRMLDLQARIHFQEIEVLLLIRQVRVHQKLDGAGVVVMRRLCHAHRDLAHAPAHFRIHQRRGRLFHHFLMTALDGTLAFAQIDRVAVLVRQHLHLDVPGIENGFLQVNFAVSESALRLALRRFQRGLQLLRGSVPGASPCRRRPPPPSA